MGQTTLKINNDFLSFNNLSGGSYDYEDWDQDAIVLHELIVTPEGSYTREEWDEIFGDDYYEDDDYYDEDRSDFFGGSQPVPDENMSQSEIIANGLQAVGLVEDSIRNNTAIWLQKVQESNIYKTISATSLVANAPGLQEDLINALSNNNGILNTWGKAFAKTNIIVGSATAVIGIADGDATPGDWVLFAGSTAGLLGMYVSPLPIVSITLSSISIILTVVGTCMNGYNNNSTY